MIRFIIESYSFRRILFLTAIFMILFFTGSKIFDHFWDSGTTIPVINLNDVYDPPVEYDNLSRINLKMINPDQLAIEGNKKLRIKGRRTNFDYYDTVNIYYPDTTFDRFNRIFIEFEDSNAPDSVYYVTSKSEDSRIYYKQIFYSSVIVSALNEFSDSPDKFRINKENLVSDEYLLDNDSSIFRVFKYFNENMSTLGLAECGTNSRIFKEICNDFDVPCRIINLQGGDADKTGYNEFIGYPLHVVCEIYSSKSRKWYIVDPSYGFRFRGSGDSLMLNAVEICNRHTFKKEEEIVQDSILLTKRSLVGKDYFKFYENIVFTKPDVENKYFKKVVSVFYSKFSYYHQLYSNNFSPVRNGIYYIGLKTSMYFFLLFSYLNLITFVFIKRLLLVKKNLNRG